MRARYLASASHAAPGVYLLKRRGKVVYVGQSVNVRQRIVCHGVKYDSAIIIPCGAERHRLELVLIALYQPVENSETYR